MHGRVEEDRQQVVKFADYIKSNWRITVTLPSLAFGFMLLVAVIRLFPQVARLQKNWPLFHRWADPDAQYRLALDDVPYDVLHELDDRLSPDASLLLVTSGQDVRHQEYIIYHRALYFFAPRPVWWLSPAPPDGAWESRWWISAPATASSILDKAATRDVSCLLFFDVSVSRLPGRAVAEWENATLWELGNGKGSCMLSADAFGVASFPSPVWPLRLAAALLVIFVLGYGVVTLIHHFGYHAGMIEAVALAWVLGVGLLTIGMWWLDVAGLSLSGQLTSLILLAGATLGWRLWRCRHRFIISPLIPSRPLLVHPFINTLLVLFLTGQIAYVALMAAGRPLTVWDSWVNWGMKARILFREGGVTSALYADPSRAVALLDYPISIPLVQAWIYRWLGAPDDRLAGVIFPLFYLALVVILYTSLRRWGASVNFTLPVTVAIAAIGHVVGLSAIAFPDAIVMVLATAAGVYLLDWLETGKPGGLLTAALAAGLLPWTKREGLIILGALCLATLLVAGWRKRRAWVALLGCSLAATLLAGPWWVFAARRAVKADVFLPLTPVTFWQNLDRLPTIVGMMTQNMFSYRTGYVWPLAALVALWGWRKDARPGRIPFLLPLTALLYLVLMSVAYLFSDFVPYQQHVASSGFRIITHVTPLLTLWLARQHLEPARNNA